MDFDWTILCSDVRTGWARTMVFYEIDPTLPIVIRPMCTQFLHSEVISSGSPPGRNDDDSMLQIKWETDLREAQVIEQAVGGGPTGCWTPGAMLSGPSLLTGTRTSQVCCSETDKRGVSEGIPQRRATSLMLFHIYEHPT